MKKTSGKKTSEAQSEEVKTKKYKENNISSSPHKECEEKIAELEDQLKRSVADFQNLEKRLEEEKRQFVKYANFDLLTRLMPAFDSLFLAEKYIEDEGLKFTVKSVKDGFGGIGVKRIDTEGMNFDAKTMECVDTVEGQENKIVEEVRPGFMLHDKVLRPANVKVGKGK